VGHRMRSTEFFTQIREGSRCSAEAIVPLALELVHPQSVVDVGCGIGTWLAVFKEHGVEDILGIDGDYVDSAMLEIPAERFLAADLSKGFGVNRRFDLAVCLEVAEQLPPECAKTLVDSVTNLAPIVLFSAAIPFQGGTHHVNEQWPDYWAKRFQERNYVVIDCLRKRIWSNPNLDWWYAQNILLFARRDHLERSAALKREWELTDVSQLAVVHPRQHLHRIRKAPSTSWRPSRADEERSASLEDVLREIRPFTMVQSESLVELALQVRSVLVEEIPGNLVECGVWRGGSAFLMAKCLQQAGVTNRKVWLFDSFEGLPAPQEIDGPAALAYASDPANPGYFDNCRASLEDVQGTAERLGLSAYTECVKGWFEETLPANRERVGAIAILRIDADWYSSVRACLTHLYDRVVPGGFVVLDDYYTYDGCALAVHEFLGQRSLSHRIEAVMYQSKHGAYCQTALFRKGRRTWKHTKRKLLKRGLL